MARRNWKGVIVKLDNSAGTITDITASVNSIEIPGTQEALDSTPLNADEKRYDPGLADATISLNGWNDSTAGPIIAPLIGNRTSITKTFKYYDGAKWYQGEMYPTEVTLSTPVGQLQTWSMTGQVSQGISNTTS